MRGFQRGHEHELERELRRSRPEPRAELLQALLDTVRPSRAARRGGSFRVVFAGALTVTMLAALASVGGIGYAASAAKQAVSSVARVAKSDGPVVQRASSASDQYDHKVTICHITGSQSNPGRTISVDEHAVPAHMRHGDHLGPCTGSETPR